MQANDALPVSRLGETAVHELQFMKPRQCPFVVGICSTRPDNATRWPIPDHVQELWVLENLASIPLTTEIGGPERVHCRDILR